MPQLTAITRFPVKGFGPERLEQVELTIGQTLPHDRTWAIENGPGDFDPAHPAHVKKKHFLMLARQAGLALLSSRFEADGQAFAVRFPDGTEITTALGDAASHAPLFARLEALLGEQVRGALRFAHIPGQALTDIPHPHVSLINAASLRDLGARTGHVIDPVRFRGNLLIDGLEPWAELDWVGRDVLIDGVRLHGQSRIRRCAATSVNPATAQSDIDLPAALMAQFGHADCGIYMSVEAGGGIAVGDAVETPSHAHT
ncbi:MOSC domain-containing protein [uncultured Maricaulis sp.]|uniref:MOSC domain-containing protein n=1 Tax=uncultured Maricaulis sp. TaxID=174710 RepID=UPI0030DD87AC|tara:strand:- start:15086 stop:15856 length:771 start_codon:yes stop_codon:yes gene_type:complete